MTDRLTVTLNDAPIGHIERIRRETVQFSWIQNPQLNGVRLSESFAALPPHSVYAATMSPFLGGYLPEGAQRKAMAAARDINERDLFAFLREYGESLAGALSFVSDSGPQRTGSRYQPVTKSVLGRQLRQSVEKHDLGIKDDSRSMIPGFQPKLLATLIDGHWHLPRGGAHSTHILKPQLKTRPTRIFDEYYAYTLARKLGLCDYECTIEKAGALPFLAIQRYDRVIENSIVTCIHQEDAAQALGLDWISDEYKFQNPKNPSSRRHASAMRISELAATLSESGSLTSWIRQFTFRILIGDNDGHAKNTSIVHAAHKSRLSPLYDAVPNLFQPERIDWSLALSVNNKFDHRAITRADIETEIGAWQVIGHKRITEEVGTFLDEYSAVLDVTRPDRRASQYLHDALKQTVNRLLADSAIGRYAD